MFEQPWKYLTDTNAVKNISNDNALIHQGKGFQHSNIHSVTAGANIDHLIITPSDVDVHMRAWQVRVSSGPVTVNAYEDAVVSNNGTAEPSGNLNRQSVIANKCLIYHTPTITSVGNLLESNFISASGSGAHLTVGDDATSPIEWLLKRNTKYIIRVNNGGGSTASVYVKLFWYEI